MPSPPRLTECSFLIPLRRDVEISDGRPHAAKVWSWFHGELYDQFGGYTVAPGTYQGVWKSSTTGQPVHDASRRFIVAIPKRRLREPRHLLREAGQQFHQQCIYLSNAGQVEFVAP
jgi:hypothetical protein